MFARSDTLARCKRYAFASWRRTFTSKRRQVPSHEDEMAHWPSMESCTSLTKCCDGVERKERSGEADGHEAGDNISSCVAFLQERASDTGVRACARTREDRRASTHLVARQAALRHGQRVRIASQRPCNDLRREGRGDRRSVGGVVHKFLRARTLRLKGKQYR